MNYNEWQDKIDLASDKLEEVLEKEFYLSTDAVQQLLSANDIYDNLREAFAGMITEE